MGSDRVPVARWIPCPGERVTKVSLYIPDDDGVLPEAGDELLWSVASRDGTEQQVYRPGDTPPGFREVHALTTVLEADQLLGFVIYTTVWRKGVSQGFTLSELRPDTYFVRDHGRMSTDEFEELATERCND